MFCSKGCTAVFRVTKSKEMALSGSSVAQQPLSSQQPAFWTPTEQLITPSTVCLYGLRTGFSQIQPHRCPAHGVTLTDIKHTYCRCQNIKSKITAHFLHKAKPLNRQLLVIQPLNQEHDKTVSRWIRNGNILVWKMANTSLKYSLSSTYTHTHTPLPTV